MKTINVSMQFDLHIPTNCEPVSDNDIQEWLEFNLGQRGDISPTNPLIEIPLNYMGSNKINFTAI